MSSKPSSSNSIAFGYTLENWKKFMILVNTHWYLAKSTIYCNGRFGILTETRGQELCLIQSLLNEKDE